MSERKKITKAMAVKTFFGSEVPVTMKEMQAFIKDPDYPAIAKDCAEALGCDLEEPPPANG